MSAAIVTALYRHPVKGLSPEELPTVTLAAGAPFPGDRLYAIENGPSGFDPGRPEHLPKIKFLQRMRHAGLARLRTRYDDATATLTIERDGVVLAQGDLTSDTGRAAIATCLEAEFADEKRGPFRVLSADGHRFMDSRKGFVSLVNRASLRAIEGELGCELDVRRFRGNIIVDGLPAWGEFDVVGKRVRIGGAVLVGLARIDRCAAIDVDPDAGRRDTNMIALLERVYEHHDCGVYLRVQSGGQIAPKDTMSILGDVAPASGTERSSLPF